MYKVGIIGTGVVGSAVAILLQQKGHTITGVCSKNGVSAADLAQSLGCRYCSEPVQVLLESEIIFITTPDRELGEVAALLASSGRVEDHQIFYQMSGALPAEVLQPLSQAGGVIASVHPLQSFANVTKAIDNLPGSFFAVQGEEKAVEVAFSLVEELLGRPFMLKSSDKALYHLGACVASNYLVSTIHYAVNIYKKIGMSEEVAINALMPLIRGTLANIEALGPVKALTGPVARGDTNTIGKHLEALKELDSGLSDFYCSLGCYTTGVAREKESIVNSTKEKLISLFREEEN